MQESRLRIATFNLENLDDGPEAPLPLSDRLAALRPLLATLDADILCLQEVNARHAAGGGPRDFHALDRLLEGTDYEGCARADTRRPDGAPADVHNLVTVSRARLLAQRQLCHDLVQPPMYVLSTAIPPDAAPRPLSWERPILHTTHAHHGRSVEVINLHLRAPVAAHVPGQKLDSLSWRTAAGWAEGFFMAAVKRTGQALETRLLVDRLFDADPAALIVVCGDFNAELAETPLRAVRAASDDTVNGGLASRALVSLDEHVPADRRHTIVHGGRRLVLDHILVSQAMAGRVVGVDILNRNLPDELAAVRWPGSFHAPVVAEFRFDP